MKKTNNYKNSYFLNINRYSHKDIFDFSYNSNNILTFRKTSYLFKDLLDCFFFFSNT